MSGWLPAAVRLKVALAPGDALLFWGAALLAAWGFARRKAWAWPVLLLHAGAASYAALHDECARAAPPAQRRLDGPRERIGRHSAPSGGLSTECSTSRKPSRLISTQLRPSREYEPVMPGINR